MEQAASTICREFSVQSRKLTGFDIQKMVCIYIRLYKDNGKANGNKHIVFWEALAHNTQAGSVALEAWRGSCFPRELHTATDASWGFP